MPTQGYSPIPVDLGSASSDIEEGRAFFQDRLRLCTGWTFVLAFGFYPSRADSTAHPTLAIDVDDRVAERDQP